MAIDALKAGRIPSWEIIDPKHRVAIKRFLLNREIRDMIDWCKSEERLGMFMHHFDSAMSEMVFSFSDQDVAFQFKMRWG